MKKFFLGNKLFFLIFALAIAARIILMHGSQMLWWDSGVYAGMAKFLFSGGAAGLWEPIRPVLLPVLLGALWKAGFGILVSALFINIVLSAASIILVFLIAREAFGKQAALFASAIFSFSSVFFFMAFHAYSEILTMFCILAGAFAFMRQKHMLAGFFIGLAFLAKFPSGIFAAVFILLLVFSRQLKNAAYFGAGFSIAAAPFFAANYFAYGNPIFPLSAAQDAISKVLGCNYLWFKPWHWYFKFLILEENFLHLFSALGLWLAVKNRKTCRHGMAILLCTLIPFAYFLQMHCRDFRYLIAVVPFIAMLSGYAISSLIKKKENFAPLLAIILVVSAVQAIGFYYENRTFDMQGMQNSFLSFAQSHDASGELWSSNPLMAFYTDSKISKIYYPVFNAWQAGNFYSYVLANSSRISYVFMDSCAGGIICPESDSTCKSDLNQTYKLLEEKMDLAYSAESGRCSYLIYEKR